VRGWDGWHRHVTFALLAHAFLEVLRAEDSGKQPKKRGETPPNSFR
jgi:SRSO17 transposase